MLAMFDVVLVCNCHLLPSAPRLQCSKCLPPTDSQFYMRDERTQLCYSFSLA